MRQAKLSLCSVLLISVAGLPAGFAAEKKLKDPVVFQRAELDEKTGKTVAAGNIWVMEADGSGLRQLTQGKKYKEHASVYADQEHVLYAEFSAGNFQPDTEAKLIKHNIYTGKREVIAEKAGCALHHATLSPIDDLLAFHHECGKELSQQVGLGKGSYHVTLRATNGVRRRDGIIAMHEKNLGMSPRRVSLVYIEGHGRDRHGPLANRRRSAASQGRDLAGRKMARLADEHRGRGGRNLPRQNRRFPGPQHYEGQGQRRTPLVFARREMDCLRVRSRRTVGHLAHQPRNRQAATAHRRRQEIRQYAGPNVGPAETRVRPLS